MEFQIKKYNEEYCEIVYYPLGIPTGNKLGNGGVLKKDTLQSRRCSISRSISMVHDYIVCNDFKYFCTWTLKEEISLELFRKKLTNIIRSYNSYHGSNIIYILVFEYDEDLRLHAHGVISDVPASYLNGYFDKKTGEAYISSKLFDKLGFQSYSPIRDKNKVATYLTKYLMKDIQDNFFIIADISVLRD